MNKKQYQWINDEIEGYWDSEYGDFVADAWPDAYYLKNLFALAKEYEDNRYSITKPLIWARIDFFFNRYRRWWSSIRTACQFFVVWWQG